MESEFMTCPDCGNDRAAFHACAWCGFDPVCRPSMGDGPTVFSDDPQEAYLRMLERLERRIINEPPEIDVGPMSAQAEAYDRSIVPTAVAFADSFTRAWLAADTRNCLPVERTEA